MRTLQILTSNQKSMGRQNHRNDYLSRRILYSIPVFALKAKEPISQIGRVMYIVKKLIIWPQELVCDQLSKASSP